jgi:hypothetical protein
MENILLLQNKLKNFNSKFVELNLNNEKLLETNYNNNNLNKTDNNELKNVLNELNIK